MLVYYISSLLIPVSPGGEEVGSIDRRIGSIERTQAKTKLFAFLSLANIVRKAVRKHLRARCDG